MGSVVNPDIIQHYHAHVYYDPASSRDRAARLRERVAATFPGATLGRWHDTPVGPHTQSMYQIAFPPPLLASFLPWLMLHPGTGDAYGRSHRPRRLVGQCAAAAAIEKLSDAAVDAGLYCLGAPLMEGRVVAPR
jgi:Dopa 4,5-dioxygenase family